MAIANLSIRIGADASGVAKAFQDVSSAVTPFASKLQSTGRLLTNAVTLPIIALGAAATKVLCGLQQGDGGPLA